MGRGGAGHLHADRARLGPQHGRATAGPAGPRTGPRHTRPNRRLTSPREARAARPNEQFRGLAVAAADDADEAAARLAGLADRRAGADAREPDRDREPSPRHLLLLLQVVLALRQRSPRRQRRGGHRLKLAAPPAHRAASRTSRARPPSLGGSQPYARHTVRGGYVAPPRPAQLTALTAPQPARRAPCHGA